MFATCAARVCVASWQDAPQQHPAVILFFAASFGLGLCRSSVGAPAFALSVPWISGLEQSGLTPGFSPLWLAGAAFWLGKFSRDLIAGAAPSSPRNSTLLLSIDCLIALTLCSLAGQIFRHAADPGFWSSLLRNSKHAYAHPHYFLSAAFIALHGLFLFRTLLCETKAEAVRRWTAVLFGVVTATVLFFVLIQWQFGIPEGWTYGFQSPYEDISSFGTFTVVLWVFFLGTLRRLAGVGLFWQIGAVLVLTALAICSYSRATWLTMVAFMVVVTMVRLPRRFAIAVGGLLACAMVLATVNANRQAWLENRYFYRLAALVRIETPAAKGSGRVEIWRRAGRMIADKPLFGKGIGTFFLDSRSYAYPNEFGADLPQFAHNMFLQVAAEQGIPAALLLAAVIGYILYRGCFHLRAVLRFPSAAPDDLLLLGLTLALAAYLQTQITANSFNVYLTHQSFFWFALYALLDPHKPSFSPPPSRNSQTSLVDSPHTSASERAID